MTIEQLYDAAKLRVRKSIADDLDEDVKRIADTALADLKRIGVDESWLENPEDPLIVETVLSFVKANYSIDTNSYPVLSGIYDMNITKVKGDGKYFTAAPEPVQSAPPQPGQDPVPDPEGGGD